jgi:hypothetical protein
MIKTSSPRFRGQEEQVCSCLRPRVHLGKILLLLSGVSLHQGTRTMPSLQHTLSVLCSINREKLSTISVWRMARFSQLVAY